MHSLHLRLVLVNSKEDLILTFMNRVNLIENFAVDIAFWFEALMCPFAGIEEVLEALSKLTSLVRFDFSWFANTTVSRHHTKLAAYHATSRFLMFAHARIFPHNLESG